MVKIIIGPLLVHSADHGRIFYSEVACHLPFRCYQRSGTISTRIEKLSTPNPWQGKQDKARVNMERALAIRRATLGDSHEDTMKTSRELASLSQVASPDVPHEVGEWFPTNNAANINVLSTTNLA